MFFLDISKRIKYAGKEAKSELVGMRTRPKIEQISEYFGEKNASLGSRRNIPKTQRLLYKKINKNKKKIQSCLPEKSVAIIQNLVDQNHPSKKTSMLNIK